MKSSREKILSAIREARRIPSQLPQNPSGMDKTIAKKLAAITPKNRQGLIKQFQTELHNVSAEFFPLSSSDKIAREIAALMKNDKLASLAIDGSKSSKKISQKIKKIKIIDASAIKYPERLNQVEPLKISLVNASCAAADVASILVSFSDTNSLLPYLLADVVCVVVRPAQVLPNLLTVFEKTPRKKLKNAVLITGPSRTADIEKIIVLGAHGPRRLIVFMFKESS
jgi:L-lactate dehydrogenase complex protein LldG